MAKLVDVPDLGSGAARRVGSSPITRTTESSDEGQGFFFGHKLLVLFCKSVTIILMVNLLTN